MTIRLGIALLMAAPFAAFFPSFTPPPGGCPCPEGFPGVTYPFEGYGVAIAVAGSVLVLAFGLLSRSERPLQPAEADPRFEAAILAIVGVLLLFSSVVVSGIEARGPGWVVLLYGVEGLLFESLGFGLLLFAGLAIFTRSRLASILIAVGLVVLGWAVLVMTIADSELALRCDQSGCSYILANQTASELTNLGFFLAIGAFCVAFGLGILLGRRVAGKSSPPFQMNPAQSLTVDDPRLFADRLSAGWPRFPPKTNSVSSHGHYA